MAWIERQPVGDVNKSWHGVGFIPQIIIIQGIKKD